MSADIIIPRSGSVWALADPEIFFTDGPDSSGSALVIAQDRIAQSDISIPLEIPTDLMFPPSNNGLIAVVRSQEDVSIGINPYSKLIKTREPLTDIQLEKVVVLLGGQLTPVLRNFHLNRSFLKDLTVKGATVGVFLDVLSERVSLYLKGSGFNLTHKVIGGSAAGSIAFDKDLHSTNDIDVVFAIEYDPASGPKTRGEQDFTDVLREEITDAFFWTFSYVFLEPLGLISTRDAIERNYLSQNLLVSEIEKQTVFKLMGCGILEVTFVVSSRCVNSCSARGVGVDYGYRHCDLIYYEDDPESVARHYKEAFYSNSNPFKVGVKRILKDFSKPWVERIDGSNLELAFQDILYRDPDEFLRLMSNLLGNTRVLPVKKVYIVIKILYILNGIGDFQGRGEIFESIIFSLERALLFLEISC